MEAKLFWKAPGDVNPQKNVFKRYLLKELDLLEKALISGINYKISNSAIIPNLKDFI